jgi:hypothetical protein
MLSVLTRYRKSSAHLSDPRLLADLGTEGPQPCIEQCSTYNHQGKECTAWVS